MVRASRLTVAGLIDEDFAVSEETLAALRAFKASRPYRGTLEERQAKFQALHAELCRVYERPALKLCFALGDAEAEHGDGAYSARREKLRMQARLSVVTYLHIFSLSLDRNKHQAFRWSLNLFRLIYPVLFERCQKVGPYLYAPARGA